MELAEQLESYEVTAVPAARPSSLRLVWSAPSEPDPGEPADGETPPEAAVLRALSPYRITLVPGRPAS